MFTRFAAAVQEPGYHRDHEVPKLALRVAHTKRGLRKSWVLRVKLRGRDTHLGLGTYPTVTLKEARKKAWAALDEIEAQRDPRHRHSPRLRELFDLIIQERAGSSTIWRNSATLMRCEPHMRKVVDSNLGDLAGDRNCQRGPNGPRGVLPGVP